MRLGTIGIAFVAAWLLISCGGSDASDDAIGADPVARSADSIAHSVAIDTSSLTTDGSQSQARATLLALDGEGLRLVDSVSGSTKALAFGTPLPIAISMLTPVVGEPNERGTNPECGAGPIEFITYADGLQIVAQRDTLFGWAVRTDGAQSLRTMSGIGIGSTRAELESVYSSRITRSSIGVEFIAGGLQGVLESEADEARITHMWAGVSCVFR